MDLDKNEIMPILERRARKIKEKYQKSSFTFLGGQFEIQIGLIGILKVHINSDGEIMKIETPEGAYLRP